MARVLTLDFLKTEAASGVVLSAAALLAVAAANSPFAEDYFAFLEHPFTLQVGGWRETHGVAEWVREGLMAIFFFIVGLEIKYEVLRGELSNPKKLALPVLAALGGMVAPAIVYLLINAGPEGSPGGWAIPAATDIAFALAALAVFGRGLPNSLRIFLLTLAIVDDLGAVVLIGVLFSSGIKLAALGGAALALGFMVLVSRWRGSSPLLYAFGFIFVWGFFLESGVSTSLAGVAAAMAIPLAAPRPGDDGVLEDYMESLHPYVAYGILPFFAFTATGFSFDELSASVLLEPLTLGVMMGLFAGKQIGVFAFAALAVRLGWAKAPSGARWLELYGVSLLCGIGFTMSLFIGALAFPGDALLQAQVRLGVIAGSLLSLFGGALALQLAAARRRRESREPAPG
ncbi:MAG: Na+/H+ antiporter NhaA [Pseudomonadota bacterium]|nr:Na+/H+ antiporter NhaA [Pseudomonadota bacterium]